MKIKGSILLARSAFVRKQFGDEGWQRLLASFPDADRRTFDSITAARWYPFETGLALDEAIVRVLGKGDASVFEKLGEASARENLAGIHKSFVELETPQGFMAKAPVIFRFYYDSGRCAYEQTGPTACSLSTFDLETVSEVDCQTVLGYYKEGLRICGARDVAAKEAACRARGDSECRFLFSWA